MDENTIYVFGAFRLDTVTQLLSNEESCVNLTPKVYRLLLFFLVHAGRLISHEELFDKVWDGRIVDDSALRLAVNSLRNALRDESKSPRYILTVCKRGYRFLAEVKVQAYYRIDEATETGSPHHQPQTRKLQYTQELAELQRAFRQASNGERCLVFLHGEQGMGKTALLDTFLAQVQYPEPAVLRARGMRGVAEPFLPLLEALENHCRAPYGRLLIERLVQLAPSWLYQMLNVPDPVECAMLLPKAAHINTGRMVREGADFFEALAHNNPYILILDNAQWSDEFTLDLLNFLMFRRSKAKLLIIVIYRSCEDEPGARRIAGMREELANRGLCQELSLQKRRS
jgi:DNA-binding winged helix-turn-helix (wHTH) protein